jgi:hypothetical protein
LTGGDQRLALVIVGDRHWQCRLHSGATAVTDWVATRERARGGDEEPEQLALHLDAIPLMPPDTKMAAWTRTWSIAHGWDRMWARSR